MAIDEDDISQKQEGNAFLRRSKPHCRFSDGFRVKGDGNRKYVELNCADSGGVYGKGNGPAATMDTDEEESQSILQRGTNRRETGSKNHAPSKVPARRGGDHFRFRQTHMDASKYRQPSQRVQKKEGEGEGEDHHCMEEAESKEEARQKRVEAGAVEREPGNLDDSFDRLPAAEDDVKRRVKVVTSPVRKKVQRRHLKAFECPQCEKFYKSVTPEERGRLMAQCSKHRAVHAPPAHSPQDFYQITSFYQDGKAQEAEKPSPLRLRKRRKKDADASCF